MRSTVQSVSATRVRGARTQAGQAAVAKVASRTEQRKQRFMAVTGSHAESDHAIVDAKHDVVIVPACNLFALLQMKNGGVRDLFERDGDGKHEV